jgi:nitroimidazol reductase NimA-like FMN-containing flavoprotein (pyridoxamine 5'-phosphate oxidase superfamily)
MRRTDRLLNDKEAIAILKIGEYGVLSTISEDDTPYGVPLNYCLLDTTIYFHCATEGRKIDNILSNANISFCVVGKTELLPDEFSTKFQSCIVQGIAAEVFTHEKQTALLGLVEKYSPQYVAKGTQYIEKVQGKTRVFKLSIETMSGKGRT